MFEKKKKKIQIKFLILTHASDTKNNIKKIFFKNVLHHLI